KLNPKPKHPRGFEVSTPWDEKFKEYYNTTDTEFWGIGIENEMYIQSAQPLNYPTPYAIQTRLSRERYSVNYLTHYKPDLKEKLSNRLLHHPTLKVPQLFNAHAFTQMDRNGQPKMTYTHDPQPNTYFTGKTILQEWQEWDPSITKMIQSQTKHDSPVFFDGDSIEFVTEHFYRTTTSQIVQELKFRREEFLSRFNEFCKQRKILINHLPFHYVDCHPGLAAMMTQPHRLVPFNNTTFHVHLTLPTGVYNGQIVDLQQFQSAHQRAIILLQWFQPYFISQLGSPDFLNTLFPGDYAGGSMRCAMSRYIGVGTYNPIDMQPGILQTYPIDSVRPSGVYWWRDRLEAETQYILPTDVIGTDIHYAKHYQCGIELRWLDGFPLEILETVVNKLVLICAYAQQLDLTHLTQNVANCSQVWNNLVFQSITKGYKTLLEPSEQTEWYRVLNISSAVSSTYDTPKDWNTVIHHTFEWMCSHLEDKTG
ncbi:MAG: hypothetical protein EB023_13640, partial [Flavobacteriia bacterium]|nr:hypothetical protein [Flavobacteriia bacterium]